MLQPGRDDNYPTTSGNVASGLLSTQFTLNGFHLSIGMLVMVILLLVVWNMARATLRRR